MRVEAQRLQRLLEQASFKTHGDGLEQEYGHLTVERFPACEEFWRLFVVPATRRLRGYPAHLSPDVHYRTTSAPATKIQDLVEAHYSVFVHLVYAHRHLDSAPNATSPSWMEDTAVHLVSACDVAETFLERAYFVLLECAGRKSEVFEGLDVKRFLERARDWYNKNYKKLLNEYWKKGRQLPIYLPPRESLMKEFFESLRESAPWDRYYEHAQSIRQFRNAVVHNSQVGRIVPQGGRYLVPRPPVIGKYGAWRHVLAAAKDPAKVARDFVDASLQLQSDLQELEVALDALWRPVVAEYKREFYSESRSTLRDMYGLEFVPPTHQGDSEDAPTCTVPVVTDDTEFQAMGSATTTAYTGHAWMKVFRTSGASGVCAPDSENGDAEGAEHSGYATESQDNQ